MQSISISSISPFNMVITLHKIDASPPARAVLMTVEILGLKIETKEVNTLAREQFNPEYLEKNPLHTVPLLEDGDFILADSHAIMTYLVSKYGADKRPVLYPADVRERATIDQRLFMDCSLIFPHVRSIVLSVLKSQAHGPSQEQIEAVETSYGYVEKYLEKSPFLAGDHITLADVSVVSSISSLDSLVPVSDKFPKVREWWDKIKEQVWYQKANVPGLMQFEGLLKNAMEKNSAK